MVGNGTQIFLINLILYQENQVNLSLIFMFLLAGWVW